MPAQDVEAVLSFPVFCDIDPSDFPDDLPLRALLANDARIVAHARGDVIYRQGEYGTSVFMVMHGSVTSAMTLNGGRDSKTRSNPAGLIGSLSRLWRGTRRSAARHLHADASSTSSGEFSPSVLTLDEYEMFGVLAALTRGPRSATVVVEDDDTLLLELRWPGVRDLLHWSEPFRAHIDELYCEWGLWNCLQGSPLFEHVDDDGLTIIARQSSFERYGEFEWTHQFQKYVSGRNGDSASRKPELVIAEQDHYLDGLLLIHSGFARVTERRGRDERTVGYASKNATIGLNEIAGETGTDEPLCFAIGLRALGYVDLVRIPTQVVEACLLPALPHRYASRARGPAVNAPPAADPARSLTEFFIENRFTNGTLAMAINTDRCVNCDDCVRACAAAHDGASRFVRHGATHRNLMIANACMHCIDPVCLIDCPTGAIHRDAVTGNVVIDGETCTGCTACAEACPYDNILMSELREHGGPFLTDEDGVQILRAEKCDLCSGQSGGPACERVCPHDALIRVDVRNTDGLLRWLGVSS